MLLLKYKYEMAGLVAGAVAGWAYWHFVGCASGTCFITSNPVRSTLYGAFMGLLLLNAFKPAEQNLINPDKKNDYE